MLPAVSSLDREWYAARTARPSRFSRLSTGRRSTAETEPIPTTGGLWSQRSNGEGHGGVLGHRPPDYRLTCFFVDKHCRRRGVSALALQSALDLIASVRECHMRNWSRVAWVVTGVVAQGVPGRMIPVSWAQIAAAVRSRGSSLRRIAPTWVLMVGSERKSAAAISVLVATGEVVEHLAFTVGEFAQLGWWCASGGWCGDEALDRAACDRGG
jgi:hypothetical protein